MKHLSTAELAAIVTGTMAVDDAARAHLRECPECSARLAAEARVERLLIAHAGSSAEGAGSRRWQTRRALRLAAAAGLVLVAGFVMARLEPRSQRTPSSSPAGARAVPVPASTVMELSPGAGVQSPADFCRTVRIPENRRAAIDASALDTLRSDYGAAHEAASEAASSAVVVRSADQR